MPTQTDTTAIVRLLLATTLVSVAALGVGLYGLLRAPAPASAPASDELAALRSELADLRHSVEVTRNQRSAPSEANAIADAERRLALLEARSDTPRPSAPPPTVAVAAAPAADYDPEDASTITDEIIRKHVQVAKSADNTVTMAGSDPTLVKAAMQRAD